MAAKNNYSKGWECSEDDYKAKSCFKPYWYAMRNPVTSVLKYSKKRKIILNKVLEIGCGGGNFGIRFMIHNLDVYFTDASMGMLKTCRYNINKILALKKNNNTKNRLFAQDMFNLGFKDEQFELVISEGVYEHLHEKEARIKFLNESKRVLKKGGCLFVAIPNNRHPLADYWKAKGYCWLDEINNPKYYEIALSPDEFRSELEETGLSDIYCDAFGLWDVIAFFPYSKFRRIITFFLKALLPEMNRFIRLKYARWIWVIGRKL
jgi:SAM-dependent methyltransferase